MTNMRDVQPILKQRTEEEARRRAASVRLTQRMVRLIERGNNERLRAQQYAVNLLPINPKDETR